MGFVILKKRRLKKAEQNMNFGKSALALKLAKPLLNVKNKEIAYSANRLIGLALYHQKKYQDSLPCLETACELGNYQHDWYNYAITLAYNGNLEKADEAFQNVYRTKVQPGYLRTTPIPVMLFQYMKALKQKGYNKKAILRANELKQMYAGVGVINTSNELSRGMPTYHNFRKEIVSLFQSEELAEWEKKNLKFEQ